NPIVTVVYATRDEASLPGRSVTFNLTNPPLVGTFLIQSVEIDQIHENSTLIPRYRVTASSVRFTLADLLQRVLLADSTAAGSSTASASTVAGGGTTTQANTRTIFDETPTGAVNGSNTVFGTANAYTTGTLRVFINGVRQRLTTDFTQTSTTSFTM